MFPTVIPPESPNWMQGPYPGVDLRVVDRDRETGGITVIRRFRAGVTVPAHIHPEADEWVYVLSGDWEEDGVVHGPGTVFEVRKGVLHGPHHARTEVLSLTRFNGPLTVSSPSR
jgi:hypothetical protein